MEGARTNSPRGSSLIATSTGGSLRRSSALTTMPKVPWPSEPVCAAGPSAQRPHAAHAMAIVGARRIMSHLHIVFDSREVVAWRHAQQRGLSAVEAVFVAIPGRHRLICCYLHLPVRIPPGQACCLTTSHASCVWPSVAMRPLWKSSQSPGDDERGTLETLDDFCRVRAVNLRVRFGSPQKQGARRPCTGAWHRRVQATAHAAVTGALCCPAPSVAEEGKSIIHMLQHQTLSPTEQGAGIGERRKQRCIAFAKHDECAFLARIRQARLPSAVIRSKATASCRSQVGGRTLKSALQGTNHNFEHVVTGCNCGQGGLRSACSHISLSAFFGPPLYARLGRGLGGERQQHSACIHRALDSKCLSVPTVQAGSALDASAGLP